MSIEDVLRTYGAAWNTDDEAERRKLLEDAWADDGYYCDPTGEAAGRDALVAMIGGAREMFAGFTIEQTSGVDEHHGWARFAWRMDGADGATITDGFDAVELADDGRIQRIIGFFGPFPEA